VAQPRFNARRRDAKRPGLLPGHVVPDERRSEAAEALDAIGPAASAAVPLLIDALKEEPLRDRAARALGKIGPEARPAVPALTALLGKADFWIDEAAAEALGKIGPAATISVEKLASLPKPESADEGILLATVAGAEALWKVDRRPVRRSPPSRRYSPPRAWPQWAGSDQSTGAAKARRRAAEVLGEIGPAAMAALPKLTELAKTDEVLTLREAAAPALKRISAGTAPRMERGTPQRAGPAPFRELSHERQGSDETLASGPLSRRAQRGICSKALADVQEAALAGREAGRQRIWLGGLAAIVGLMSEGKA
jgi:HEAT repeat protein